MTIAQALFFGEALLAKKKVPEASANAEFILADVMGLGRAELRAFSGQSLSPKQELRFGQLLKQRSGRIPLAYVLGVQPFMGLQIKVSENALIPRPETEQLVETVVDLVQRNYPSGSPVHILEIGTGTGCVSIALATKLAQAMLYATDVSPGALELAQENARRLRVDSRIRFLSEDLFRPAAVGRGPWADVIVSNPPYIPTAQIRRLEPEVLKEPVLALDGGADGLKAIKAIIGDASRQLKSGGWLALEIGDSQSLAVSRLLSDFGAVEIRKDLSGRERIVLAQCLALPETLLATHSHG